MFIGAQCFTIVLPLRVDLLHRFSAFYSQKLMGIAYLLTEKLITH